MFDCTTVTLFLLKTEKKKFRLKHRKSGYTHSGTGIKGKNAGIWAKKCEIFEECYLRQWVGMIQSESAVEYWINILSTQQTESLHSDRRRSLNLNTSNI